MKKRMHIHFVGIKGVGMTPLALIAKEANCEVTGSDIEQEFITDAALKKAGIVPLVGFSADHITNPDLVITSGANGGYANVEVVTAKGKGIQVMSHGEAVGVFMSGAIFGKKLTGISVAGTHGKTTTTAILATILKENKLDPSYIIGTGDVGSLGAPGHFGKGKFFVAEADEYATEPKLDKTPRFLWQHPQIAIITNIEFDHPDMYHSLEEVHDAFAKFVAQLPNNGLLIACGDEHELKRLLKTTDKNVVTYGFNPDNTYVITRASISGDQMFFWVSSQGAPLGEFVLRVIGEHNALNALAAIVASLEAGVSVEKIKKALPAFQGSKRRLEYIGELKTGAKLYDDYAHHPTEIKKTLAALRTQYPKKKIICIFQPHTYSRTKMLFQDFARAFDAVDTVIVPEIYASRREEPDPTISSERLVEAISQNHRDVLFMPKLEDVVQYISKNRFRSDTIIVTMGAGDIYTIHSRLDLNDE